MAQEEEIDFSKLSIEERVQHKNWKGRVSGFEALIKTFTGVDDDKSSELTRYAGCLKKVPVDSNVMALEKGLAAIQAFLNVANPTISAKIASDVIAGCLTKAILQTRPKIKELTSDIVLMYIELERHEIVIEELIKGAENKSPKVAVGCISLLREGLHQFGIKVIKINPIIKLLPVLLEHKDKNIREESRLLAIEIYRWIKDAMKPQIANLKPVVLSELEEEFNKVKDERPACSRYLRSEQAHVNEAATHGDDEESGSANATQAPSEEIDPFEMFDPVEILSKMPSDFYEKCEAKKWQERKEALDALLALLNPNPKLAQGDYGELVKTLKKIVGKDANVIVVGVAAKCLAELATKLRKHFAPYSHGCITVYIEKFKEKKQNVVLPLREAIDAAIISINFETVIEDIVAACDNKNPQIKSEIVQFIIRFVTNSPLDFLTNKKNLKLLVTALIKTLNDNDGGVRDFSAEALGCLMKAVGEKTMQLLLTDVDAIKVTKIKECFEKAAIKHCVPVARAAAPVQAASKAAEKRLPEAEPKKSTTARPKTASTMLSRSKNAISTSNKNLVESESVPPASAPAARPATATISRAKVTNKTASVKSRSVKTPLAGAARSESEPGAGSTPLLVKNTLKEQRFIDEKQLKILKWNFTSPREEFFAELKELMQLAGWSPALIINCFHVDFKYHLKAIESLMAFTSNSENDQATLSNSDLVLKWAALRFFDTNPSVILKLFELLSKLFSVFRSCEQLLSETEAQNFIPYLILKAGDPKDVLRQKVHVVLDSLKDIYHPLKLFSLIMTGLSSKNARQRATCIDELGFLIKVYGMGVCQPSPVQACKEISRQIGDKDSGVRNAALNCIVEIYQFEEDRVFKLIGSLNDKDMEMLEKRLKRASRPNSRVPTKPLEPTILIKDVPVGLPPVAAPVSQKLLARSRSSSPESSKEPSPQQKTSQSNLRRPLSLKPRTPATVTKANGMAAHQINYNGDLASANNSVNGDSDKQRKPVQVQRTRTPSPIDYAIGTGLSSAVKANRPQSIAFTPEELEQKLQSTGLPTKANHSYLRRPQAAHNFDTNATDELLAMPDVELPNRLRLSLGGSSASANEKADRLINTYISQLSQTEIDQAFEAAQQIGHVLAHQERASEYFSNKVDRLIMLCLLQYRLVINKHLTDRTADKESVKQLLNSITDLLMSIFQNDSLSKRASLEMLKELITLIINLIIDNRIVEFVDDNTTIRSANQLANTILSNADSTSMLSALIRVMHECIASKVGTSNLPKFTELITKCIWKLIHQFKLIIKHIRIEQILFDIYNFLEEFPASHWENPKENNQFRTLRIILLFFVMHKKDQIFKYMDQIPDKENTELYRVLRKTYEVQKESEDDQMQDALSEEDSILLEQFLKHIRTEPSVKLVLDLIEFCGCHPRFHLENHLFENFPEPFAKKVIEQITSVKNTGQLSTASHLANGSNGNGSAIKNRLTDSTNKTDTLRSTFGFNRAAATPRQKLSRLQLNGESATKSQFSDFYNSTYRTLNKEATPLRNHELPPNATPSELLKLARGNCEQFIARKEQFASKFKK